MGPDGLDSAESAAGVDEGESGFVFIVISTPDRSCCNRFFAPHLQGSQVITTPKPLFSAT